LWFESSDRFAFACGVVIVAICGLTLVRGSPNARIAAAVAIVLTVIARFGIGPIYWDKLLFYGSIACAIALALSPPRRSLTLTLGAIALSIAASYAVSLKKPGRTRDQRAAFAEIIGFLSRDGQARFRYATVGFGKEQLELGRRVQVGTIDGGMPWLTTLPELGEAPSIDELSVSEPAAEAALRKILARADELSLAYVISADPSAAAVITEAGYRSAAAFAGNVVLFVKDVPPIVERRPEPPAWARGLSVKGWSVLWSAGQLLVLAATLGVLGREIYGRTRVRRRSST
jgi:hypothetical protein